MEAEMIIGREELEMLYEMNMSNGVGVFLRVETQTGGDYRLANHHATEARANSHQRVCETYARCRP